MLHLLEKAGFQGDSCLVGICPPRLAATADGVDFRLHGGQVEIVAHVDQEFMLFEGSVRDNVALWEPTVSERRHRAGPARCRDTRRRRPAAGQVRRGGRRGRAQLSGGQRQRLEIARALARDPAVLVLDEATAALDPVTELEIDDRLRRRGCTCLIVAHRLSTIRDADAIIVLDGGRIAPSTAL